MQDVAITTPRLGEDADRFDVAVVGLGPTGLTAALLLARSGYRVLAVEKHAQPYPLPRAVRFTGEIARAFDWIGISDYIDDFSYATLMYEWQSADRRTLLQFPSAADGDQGWPDSNSFNQPGLENRLRRRVAEFENITVRHGLALTGVEQDADGVRLSLDGAAGPESARARYLIAADGANSFVRDALGIPVEDLGFVYDWLVIDILPKDDRVWEPDNLQVCDPARPVTMVGSGPGRRRLEFLLTPQDDLETFDSEENTWRLLATQGVTPATAEIERRKLYTFRARWAQTWRRDAIFLAGDAAHQMPPFYGQGLGSGIRDAVNLAWKLDLVLSGRADEGLLDTYSSERIPHAEHAVWMSVELGKVICQTDPAAVAARDEYFLEHGPNPAEALPAAPPERLGKGVFPGGDPASSPIAGLLGVQGRVRHPDGSVDLLDRAGFGDFAVIADGALVDESQLEQVLEAIPDGVRAVGVRVLPSSAVPRSGSREVADEDDRYLPWLRSTGDAVRIVRPDFYVFGGSGSPADAVAQAHQLGGLLSLHTERSAR